MTDASMSPNEDDTVLAGEYALRLLSPLEEISVRRRIAAEPAFAALVRGWQNEFSTIAEEEVEEVAPDIALRKTLMQRVFAEEPAPSIWEKLGIWQWAAMAAVVVGLAFFATSLLPTAAPDFIAEMAAEDGSVAVTASYFTESQDVVIELTGGAAPNGRALEVWGIVDGQAPVSLGVIPADGSGRFNVPEELEGKWAGMICAVSVEPLGGSPTGLPTGEVLATAELRRL